ncbi:MAG: patatin-like phospholipase family protein, partial [Alphaproteobacteria bacterium]|nr:patatin-like phospholipase family protein [Alphaproteobacteria bacterium]
MKDNALTQSLRFVRTRLNSFAAQEQGHLINWGYVLADTAIRRWVDPAATADWAWPVPEYALDK